MRWTRLLPLALVAALAAAWALPGPAPLGAAFAVLLAAAGAAWRPGGALALLVGVAPGIDLVAGLILRGRAESGNPGLPTLVEPLALGFALGLLMRRSRAPVPPRSGGSGGRLLLAAVLASLTLALIRFWGEWGEHLTGFLALAARALPAHDATTSEHLLRAALILIAPVGWLALLRDGADGPLFGMRFWRWAAAGPLIAGVLAAELRVAGLAREPIFLDDKNADGSLLLLSLFGALHLARRDPSRVARRCAVFGALVAAALLLRTGSRAALVAGALGGLVLVGAQLAARRARRGGTPLVGVIALASVALLALAAIAGPWRARPWADYLEVNRFAVWAAAVRATASEPILGLGPGQLFRLLGAFHPPDPASIAWRPPRENAHDQFLQVGAEVGLLGAAGFVFFLGASLRRAWRARPPGETPFLAAGATAYVLTLLTGHPLLLSRQALLFWTFLAAAGALRAGSTPAARVRRYAPWGIAALGLVLSLPARPLPCAAPHEVTEGVRWEFAAGFHDEETGPEGAWQWMKDVGQVRFCNDTDRPVPLPRPFRAASFVQPRRLAFFPESGGSPIVIRELPLELPLPEQVLPPDARVSLLLLPDPGAASIATTLGTPDPRRVSLRCSGPRTMPAGVSAP